MRPGMRNGIYNPGQAIYIFREWPTKVEWFVIGGPADANEALTVVKRYPEVKCVGFEPNKTMFDYQLKAGFPGDLYRYALWKENTNITFQEPHGNESHCGGLIREYGDDRCKSYDVEARTLDSLRKEFGPWKNSVLWLDIERSEMQALAGADEMLRSGDILLINIEVMQMSINMKPFEDLLGEYGFKRLKIWNTNSNPDMCDAVFGLEK